MQRKIVVGGMVAAAALLSAAVPAGALEYEVEIRNLSRQVITPPLIVTHEAGVAVFTPGEAASAELAEQAETGNPMPLATALEGQAGVAGVAAGGDVLPPGMATTLIVNGPVSGDGYLTFTSMLATTNDAFAALNSVPLPAARAIFRAPVYDAGSEGNNELCSHIPGPPCGGDSGNEKAAGAEGFIHIHPGLHGGGDLNAADLGWLNPAVQITVSVAGMTELPRSLIVAGEPHELGVGAFVGALTDAGFADVNDVEKDGTIFETAAMWKGNPVRLRYDAELNRLSLL